MKEGRIESWSRFIALAVVVMIVAAMFDCADQGRLLVVGGFLAMLVGGAL